MPACGVCATMTTVLDSDPAWHRFLFSPGQSHNAVSAHAEPALLCIDPLQALNVGPQLLCSCCLRLPGFCSCFLRNQTLMREPSRKLQSSIMLLQATLPISETVREEHAVTRHRVVWTPSHLLDPVKLRLGHPVLKALPLNVCHKAVELSRCEPLVCGHFGVPPHVSHPFDHL
jgi:hypothetical protein